MTTKKNFCGILAGLLLVAAGCADNNPWGETGDSGALRPVVSVDAAVGAAVTRAQMEELPEADVPSANDFTLEIIKSDGSYSKSWLLADYDPQSVALRSGSYVVTARYGDPREEGNKRPYFVGSANVTVKAGETTPVNIEAALGNALVEITQTDNFLNYFSDFNLTLHSGETGAVVAVPRGQTDPTYVHPGQVAVVLSYPKDGKTVEIRPVTLTVQAKKFYHVSLDLDQKTGGSLLHVTFDNGIQEEEVDIDLSAVENAPEPTVTASPEAAQSLLEGTRCAEAPKFTLHAPAGIQSAAITLTSDHAFSFPYAGQDLCALSADGQAAVESYGIKTLGLFKNPEKMAEIDLSGFASQLSPGTHEVTVTLTDALSRQASASLSFDVKERRLSVESVGKAVYASQEVEVTVSYNGDPEGLAFSVMSDTGAPESAQVKSITKLTANAGEFDQNSYKAIIEVPSMRCERGIWVRLNGKATDGDPDAVATPEYPQYSAEADAYAKRAYVKITSDDLQTVMAEGNLRLTLYDNNSEHPNNPVNADIKLDDSTGIVTISGLTPGHQHTLAHSLDHRAAFDAMQHTSFVTEAAADVPNGDFENYNSDPTLDYTINQGGEWTITRGGSHHQTTVSVKINEPIGWASNNSMTTSGSNANTWYWNPTVYASNVSWTVHQPEAGATILGNFVGQNEHDEIPEIFDPKKFDVNSGTSCVVVRNVGWDSNGSSIGYTNQTGNADFSNYYCHNSPTESEHAIGKFFLGSYSYSNGTETYNEGADFSSRPSKFSGFYKFSPISTDSEEKGKVIVSVLSGSKILASGTTELSASESYNEFEIPLNYEMADFGQKATSVRIMFMSSNHQSDNDVKVAEHKNKQEQCFRGATLTIDNLTFNYD